MKKLLIISSLTFLLSCKKEATTKTTAPKITKVELIQNGVVTDTKYLK